MQVSNFHFDGPAGPLEALFETDGDPTAVAVVCHPHPLHQGSLRNKVAHTLARSMLDLHIGALRFNFRGVGSSAGTHDHGVGEVDDALAAADWLIDRYPDRPLIFCGFSFGSGMAALAAVRHRCDALVTIAPAVRHETYADFVQPDTPWLIVQGGADEIVDCDAVVKFVDGLNPGPELIVCEGVGHFFHGQLTMLRRHVSEFIGRQLTVS